MIRRPPRSTRTDTLFPTRRSSDLKAGTDSERCLLTVAELVADGVVLDEEIRKVEVERRRADVEEQLAAAGVEVVLVEAEAVQQGEVLDGAHLDPADEVGQLVLQTRALREYVVVRGEEIGNASCSDKVR